MRGLAYETKAVVSLAVGGWPGCVGRGILCFEGIREMTVTAGRSTAGPVRENITMIVGVFLVRRVREAGNGVAGSCAGHVPVICIAGPIPLGCGEGRTVR